MTQATSRRAVGRRSTDELVRGFEQLRASDDEVAGYKGANLGELTAGLLPVPQGFVITSAAYRLAMARPHRQQLLALMSEALGRGEPTAVERAALAIRGDLARDPVPAELASAITHAYRKLGDDVTVVVRSSMICDDRAGTSLRSATESFTDVKGETSLLEKVIACWMNLWCPSMVGYRQLWNQRDAPTMGIVVQRMIRGSKSGVLLTTDPAATDRSRILIEATGRPAASGPLVHGSADAYSVRKADMRLVETKLAADTTRAASAEEPPPTSPPATWMEGRGMSEQERRKDARVLTNHQVFALSSIGADVERQYGRPQEVDWVFEDGSFYLLRSRSIPG